MNKKHIKDWLENNGHKRLWLAEKCGVSIKTVNNWLGSDRPIPAKAAVIITNLMAADQARKAAGQNQNLSLVLEFTDAEFHALERTALASAMTLRDWAKTTLNAATSQDIDEVASKWIPAARVGISGRDYSHNMGLPQDVFNRIPKKTTPARPDTTLPKVETPKPRKS